MKPVSNATSHKTSVSEHLGYRYLICELRQLMQLTQTQLAQELGVTYETVNRWENGHIQPSPLALKQIRSAIDQLNQSSSATLRDSSQLLLDKYFLGK
nr:helix-turn-helix transcriptional regulator [Leptolyngbya ohadii]